MDYSFNTLFESVFQGFFLYSLIALVYSISVKLLGKILFPRLDDAVVALVRGTGILFLLVGIAQITITLLTGEETEKYAMLNRMFGPFWFAYWISFVAYGLLPQLLWMGRVKRSLGIRLLISILIISVLFLEGIIIIITSYHGDFIPICRTFESNGALMGVLKALLIFCAFTYLVYLFIGRFQRNEGE